MALTAKTIRVQLSRIRPLLEKSSLETCRKGQNKLGELMEWTGFAILLGNPAGWMFVWWTAANLVPRAHAIHRKYREEFGNEAVGRRKRIIPFLY